MWVARENIDCYKKGDVVPDDKAIVWHQMYEKSPVEQVPDEKSKDEEKAVVLAESPSEAPKLEVSSFKKKKR